MEQSPATYCAGITSHWNALAGAIMAPLASMTAVEGATYYNATTKHLLVCTDA